MKSRNIIYVFVFLTSISTYSQESLTLEEYKEKVLNYSQIYKQSQEQIQAAKAGASIAFKGYLPKLDLGADASLNLKDIDKWSNHYNHTYGADLTLSQPLYTGGALKAQEKIAQREVELNELNQELTIDQIYYQANSTYWNASANLALYKSAKEFYEIVKRQHDVISDRFEDGMISRTDLLMISTRLKEAELQQLIANKNYTLAMQNLHILMGVEPNAPMEDLMEINAPCPKPINLTLDEVLNRRPDYVSTQIDIERQHFVRQAAISKYNPNLSMYVNGGWGIPNLKIPGIIPGDPDFTSMAGINLSIPILRWGERKQTNKQNRALINIKKLQQSTVADQINQEYCAAWTKITQTNEQVAIATDNANLAQENLDLVTFSYNEGKASIVDVLSAQLSWTQAQSNIINALYAHKMALAEYQKVIAFTR
ncbi:MULTISPECIES: TolC family protein [unclassified Bacteroides]|jgi:outer membrane protein TolC|uniref:TolC family protein n=1 Tax=unclassified Bacteroides TaxID=2646097 RepID=UPI000E7F7009|nr:MULTISPECIES: TolC family protein [unclassified Bacteroides]RGN47393.1 TolC family protein [Bacteroides sp. OM05-12]RHR75017.1 TolC family protein [Bacteroides sp. AF16-49]